MMNLNEDGFIEEEVKLKWWVPFQCLALVLWLVLIFVNTGLPSSTGILIDIVLILFYAFKYPVIKKEIKGMYSDMRENKVFFFLVLSVAVIAFLGLFNLFNLTIVNCLYGKFCGNHSNDLALKSFENFTFGQEVSILVALYSYLSVSILATPYLIKDPSEKFEIQNKKLVLFSLACALIALALAVYKEFI